MFSAAEMQLIRSHHAADYESLLRDLSIPIPDWESDDELRVYDEIDDKLTKKLFGLMKSPTLYDGYTKLLKLGGVPYDYSETYNQMLGMVVANKEEILSALQQVDDYNKPEPEPVERVKIEVTKLKPFDEKKLNILESAWEDIKNFVSKKLKAKSTDSSSYSVAYRDIEGYVSSTKKLNSLFELSDDKRSFYSFDDFARAYSTGDNYAVQLKITKTVERREKQNSTPAPEFTVDEMEHVLNILERVDDIVKKI